MFHALALLPARPPWWRPFARRRWERAYEVVAELVQEYLDAQPRINFAAIRKDPDSPGFWPLERKP